MTSKGVIEPTKLPPPDRATFFQGLRTHNHFID